MSLAVRGGGDLYLKQQTISQQQYIVFFLGSKSWSLRRIFSNKEHSPASLQKGKEGIYDAPSIGDAPRTPKPVRLLYASPPHRPRKSFVCRMGLLPYKSRRTPHTLIF